MAESRFGAMLQLVYDFIGRAAPEEDEPENAGPAIETVVLVFGLADVMLRPLALDRIATSFTAPE